MLMHKQVVIQECHHCGASCELGAIEFDTYQFCCEGCKLVYELLKNNNLCDYYSLEQHPGLQQIKSNTKEKFAYLEDPQVQQKLIQFTDQTISLIEFYLPNVHCSSCMWLIEHLNRLDKGVIESRLNFGKKTVQIKYLNAETTIRKIVSLLSTIGYEPYISLEDISDKEIKNKILDKSKIFKLGIAGFCFGNIMMMSFPEYLSDSISTIEQHYTSLFRYINLLLSLPVFFYSASEFFITAWKGIQQRFLNIDAPIALAILITFTRSVYEILNQTGAGYLDSMSGIVFFMLVGRVLQERTQSSISFHRNYTSYFPISVTIITDTETSTKEVSALNAGDCILLHAEEIVPADCIVKKGTAYIDYSFVSGESNPVRIKEKEIVYAGGKQINESVVLEVVKPIEQSYLTSLWNHFSFSKNKEEENKKNSFIPILSNYFSSILFTIAIITAIYWYFVNPSLILPSVSAVLIVACPCALLLTSTFTNGIMMKLLSDHGLYLRDASVIEQLSKTNHIVFDKTGTLTHGHYLELISEFAPLNKDQKLWIYNVAQASQHPMAKALCTYLGKQEIIPISHWTEVIGAGIMATVAGKIIQIGSREFTSAKQTEKTGNLWISIDGVTVAVFESKSQLRSSLPQLFNRLKKRFQFSLLSGDTEKDKTLMQCVFPKEAVLQFGQKPLDKLHFIESLQTKGMKVLMIGDGLNDAGALQQSNVGITLSENINNFSPSCDAILDAKQFGQLPNLIKLATFSNTIIAITFFVSILYNIIGIGFSVQGKLNPMIAAILMPTSTISIILLTTGLSYWGAKRFLK